MAKLEKDTFKLVDKSFEELLSSAQKAGWSLEYVQFSPNQFRYSTNKKSN